MRTLASPTIEIAPSNKARLKANDEVINDKARNKIRDEAHDENGLLNMTIAGQKTASPPRSSDTASKRIFALIVAIQATQVMNALIHST